LVEKNEQGHETPKNVFKFIATALWSGATYAAMDSTGRSDYVLMDAYKWLEAIGGAFSPSAIEVAKKMYLCLSYGGVMPETDESVKVEVQDKATSKKKASRNK